MQELEKKVAEKLGIPEEQVRIVINDLFVGVKYYIYQPHLVKWGIMLNGFCKIRLNFNAIEKYVERYKLNLLKFPRLKFSIQYWEQVLNKRGYYGNYEGEKQIEKHKR